MAWQKQLLWIDGIGGAAVGVVVILVYRWLAQWHNLPENIVGGMGIANLAYGTYSLTLASRSRRPLGLIGLLVVANLVWAGVCARWVVVYWEQITAVGLLHVGGEGVYVAVLAGLEWRYRRSLITRSAGT